MERSLPFVVCFLALVTKAAFVFDFETDLQGWVPVVSNTTITRTLPGHAPSVACLHATGVSTAGTWNYARSPQNVVNVTAGQLYRFSAWLFVPGTVAMPSPSLKIEFTLISQRAQTSEYDMSKKGTWQRVWSEFTAPVGAKASWLAIEKGSNLQAFVDVFVDDIRIEEISQSDPWWGVTPFTIPPQLEAVRGVHPRVIFTASSIVALKPTLSDPNFLSWRVIFNRVKNALKNGPPAYFVGSDPEELWQRSVGSTIPYLALYFLVTGNQTYLNSAASWALASCSYPTWGQGTLNGSDLAAGHQLLGLSMLYDWCHDYLNATTLATIRNTLIVRGGFMAQLVVTGDAWWADSFLQNHQWVNTAGYTAAALALFDDPDPAVQNLTLKWLSVASDTIKISRTFLGTDGASQEGVGYWGYGVENLMKWYDFSAHLFGENLYTGSAWWSKTADYRLYMSLPRTWWKSGNTNIDFADSPRHSWYGNDYLLYRLADEFNDPVAQWLANEILNARVNSDDSTWLGAAWFKQSIVATSPAAAGKPSFKYFDDLEIASSRSDWSGNESLLVAKCGPPLGHAFQQMPSFLPGDDAGGGHAHPDAGGFIIFGKGDWQIIDDGYQDKWTAQHNTFVLRSGGQLVGQCGEGERWMQAGQCTGLPISAKITKAQNLGEFDLIVMDATGAYGLVTSPRVIRFVRHLVFFKKLDVLIVVDDIQVNGTTELDLLFHTEQLPNLVLPNIAIANGTRSNLRIEALTNTGVAVTAGILNLTGLVQKGVRLQMTGSSWRNAVAISWAATGKQATDVTLTEAASRWHFSIPGAQPNPLVFDWLAGGFDVGGHQSPSVVQSHQELSEAAPAAIAGTFFAMAIASAIIF